MFFTACNTEQHGGWKSKGGDKIPSFRNSEPASTPSISARVAVEQVAYNNLNSDLLLCEKTSSVKDKNLNLSYSIIGAMVGFDLTTILNSTDADLKLKTLQSTDATTTDPEVSTTSIKDLKLVEVKSLDAFIDRLYNALETVDVKLAQDLINPIKKSVIKPGSEISSLVYFNTADDGRKCYSSNLVEENYFDKNISILDENVFDQISPLDQSLLLLTSSLSILAFENGSSSNKDLLNFVYYLHTEELLKDLENTTDRTNTKNQLLGLVESFIPLYGKPKP